MENCQEEAIPAISVLHATQAENQYCPYAVSTTSMSTLVVRRVRHRMRRLALFALSDIAKRYGKSATVGSSRCDTSLSVGYERLGAQVV